MLKDKLIALLKTNKNFINNNKELLVDKILSYDNKKELIKLLLKDEDIKKYFFEELEGEYIIFKENEFITFLKTKEYLKNSWSKYDNKVKFNLRQAFNDNVVLNFPYKDCVLEGGQTKEDERRDERFYNEILCKEEINRMFEPKVFTNYERIGNINNNNNNTYFNRNENGVITDNLLIKGNNLIALHSLVEEFRGKIKLIYIDPPYNTGSDEFKYNDNFNHSTWLCFMKNRLEMARELLSDDGSVFINIDYNEVYYLKILMDEIFGRDNFVNDIIWSYISGGTSDRFFARKHDNVLFYQKTENRLFNPLKIRDEDKIKKLKKENIFEDDKGEFIWYIRPNTNEKVPDGVKQYLDKTMRDVWEIPIVNPQSKELIGFKGQKPELLIERIIKCSTNEGDIVLDFFSGSGTTGAVAHKMKRQWIMIEQMDYIETITKERLKKVIDGEQNGISKSVNWLGGGEFIYMELKKYNQIYIDKINEAKTQKDLANIFNEIYNNAIINHNIKIEDLKYDIENNNYEISKEDLIDILNKNILYIPYSMKNDSTMKVTKEEKGISDDFYKTSNM